MIEKKQRGWFVCDLDGNANEEGKAHERKTLRRPHGFAPGQDHLLDSAPQAPIVPKPKGEGPRKKKPKSQAGPGPVPPGAVRARTAGGRARDGALPQAARLVRRRARRRERRGRRVRAEAPAAHVRGGPGRAAEQRAAGPEPGRAQAQGPGGAEKSPAKAAAAAPAKDAKKPSSKPSVRKPSSARPLSSSSVPVAAVIPADTPQGLAACFAAFYPGSKAEDKAKFQQFVLDNTLCPRHVLNMPVEKCESMLQQHGFEGVVVFTFQSRLREVCLPAAARGA